ncbi:MAG TPA: prolyl oligopeptidase family serine peptidase [Sedimentisphaerales bacterium]|nr:prolyl oligopeptidase family serine peptidase [Sedimentisphaerales bacterium]
MREMCRACIVLLVFLFVGCESRTDAPMQQQQTSAAQDREVFEKVTEGASYRYLLYLPEGYGKEEGPWPTIVFLHGIGNRGDDLDKVKTSGIPRVVERDKRFDFVLVAPQCPQGEWWSSDLLIKLVDEAAAKYSVDTNRIYLTGLSMGGFGTWSLGCAYPERFAAIAPICGGGEPDKACRLKDVPVWAFHGARDEKVPLAKSQEMVEAVKACGGGAKLTVYPEAGHDSWTQTYDNPQLYEWFLKHRRSNNAE